MKNRCGYRTKILAAALAIAALALLRPAAAAQARGAGVLEKDNILFIVGRDEIVSYNLKKGTFDLVRTNGELVILAGRAEAVVSVGGEKKTLSPAGAAHIGWYFEDIQDAFGKGIAVTVTAHVDDTLPDVIHVFRVYESQPFLLVAVGVENGLAQPVGIEKLSPIVISGANGAGLFLGIDPANIRVLENGHKNRFDFWVRLVGSTDGSDSNWSSALFDPPSGRALVGGFLTQDAGLGAVLVSHDKTLAAADSETARSGLSGYHARESFSPIRKLDKFKRFVSDPFFLDLAWDAPFESLDLFARAAGTANGVTPFKFHVPAFWDTWYSRHSEKISEEIVLANLDAVAEKLAPYGMNTFEIDAGWQDNRGDWQPNERFPRGMKFVADAIAAKNLTPAIWIAPFLIEKGSSIYRDRPDWALDLDTYGQNLISKDVFALDISNPDAKEFLRALVRRITAEWGFKMLKVDFTYFSLAGKKYFERGRTRVEIFRDAFRLIREAAGPDVYILAVGVPVGIHAGLVDGMRTGLDNSPNWGEESGYAVQGTLPSYRDMIRRFFLNGAVWNNDPDAIYTGEEATSARWSRPPQPANELIAWISAVGLSGQIVELADAPAELDADRLRLVRSILPVYHKSARPIDLFVKDAPEILDLEIEAPFGDWHVVGLFNWGENSALGKNGKNGKKIESETRVVHLSFPTIGLSPNSECHIYDFWNDRYLGKKKFGYAVTLGPRSASVVSVRPALDRPQFLSTNRHITQGATDISAIAWDPAALTLTGAQEAVPGFGYHLAFHVPEDYKYTSASMSAGQPSASVSADGRILNLFFKPADGGEITWTLKFTKVAKKQ